MPDFTLSHAKLYFVLELLQQRVLYFDTDSIIYTSKPGEWNPPLGDYLGELTNELDDDDYITTFVSWGPKNYSYQTKNGKTVCKVRGFTLNYRGSQNLNFAAMCSQTCNPNGEPIYLENPHFIKRDAKTITIHTIKLKKKYNLVYDKRVVQGFNTFPYGYHWIILKWMRLGLAMRGGWRPTTLATANLQPIWTHCILTWYVSAPKRLYWLVVYRINCLNSGWNFWGNWSRWIGDVYYAFMPIWNTVTWLLVNSINFTKYYMLLTQTDTIILLPGRCLDKL